MRQSRAWGWQSRTRDWQSPSWWLAHCARHSPAWGSQGPEWWQAQSSMEAGKAHHGEWQSPVLWMALWQIQHGGWHSPVWWMALWRSPAWLASWKYPVGLASVRSTSVSWERVARRGSILKGNGIVKSSRACNRKDGGMAMGSQSVL